MMKLKKGMYVTCKIVDVPVYNTIASVLAVPAAKSVSNVVLVHSVVKSPVILLPCDCEECGSMLPSV